MFEKAKALKNKLRSAAGAPGRMIVEAHARPRMERANKHASFLKSYNDRSKSGMPISNKERAQFQGLKDHYSK